MYLLGRQMDIIRKIPGIIRKLIVKIPLKRQLGRLASAYLLKEACRLSLAKPEQFFSKAIEGEILATDKYKNWSEEKLAYCLKKGGGTLAEGLRIYDILFNRLGDKYLVKVDRASMSVGLETRSPFLDYRFIQLGQQIPTKWKFNLLKTKIIMREIIKNKLPHPILRRGKQGFDPPIDKWIENKTYEKDIKKGLHLLKYLDPEIHEFYSNKVMNQASDRLNKINKIKLYLFANWWEEWIRE